MKGESEMIDKRLYIHTLEESSLKEMMDSISYSKEIMGFYENYTEKARKPDLMGKTVRVTSNQFGEVYHIAQNIASILSMEVPQLYIYEDFYYGIESKGAVDPWIEISAKTILDFSEQELTFLLAKEMYEISQKHTYLFTLVNEIIGGIQNNASFIGAETFKDILKIKMYKWCRMACYSSDSFGYAACRNLKSSISSIKKLVLNNVQLANRVSTFEYIKQANEINLMDDEIHNFSRSDEMVPYGPFRIKNLIAYASSNRGIEAIIYFI